MLNAINTSLGPVTQCRFLLTRKYLLTQERTQTIRMTYHKVQGNLETDYCVSPDRPLILKCYDEFTLTC